MLLEYGLTGRALQGCKPEACLFIPSEDELDAALAEVADSIEEDDGGLRTAYFRLWKTF